MMDDRDPVISVAV